MPLVRHVRRDRASQIKAPATRSAFNAAQVTVHGGNGVEAAFRAVPSMTAPRERAYRILKFFMLVTTTLSHLHEFSHYFYASLMPSF